MPMKEAILPSPKMRCTSKGLCGLEAKVGGGI